MKETLEEAVSLPEDDPEAFDVLVAWMYGNNNLEDRTESALVLVYALADKFCMPSLQNTILTAFKTLLTAFKTLLTAFKKTIVDLLKLRKDPALSLSQPRGLGLSFPEMHFYANCSWINCIIRSIPSSK